jgi:hypothetical protein
MYVIKGPFKKCSEKITFLPWQHSYPTAYKFQIIWQISIKFGTYKNAEFC